MYDTKDYSRNLTDTLLLTGTETSVLISAKLYMHWIEIGKHLVTWINLLIIVCYFISSIYLQMNEVKHIFTHE